MSTGRKVTVHPAVLGVAIVVAGLVGAGVHAAGSRAGEPPLGSSPAEAVEPRPQVAGPTRVEAGVPAGFAQTRDGAVAAASSFVTTGQAILGMNDLQVEQAVRQMAAGGAADGQVRDTMVKLSSARAALAGGNGPIVFRQAAVAGRVAAWSPERARVAIWNVGVLSRTGIAPPQAGWATSVFELVWERGDWKVWSETITPGPAPIADASAAPATSEQFARDLEGFVDLGGGW